MAEITSAPVGQVRLDLSKRVSQARAVDAQGRVVLAKAMPLDRLFAWCAELPSCCIVTMETCGAAHPVAHRLRLLGVDARLIASHFVTSYSYCMAGKSSKNDANDAAPSLRQQAARTYDSCQSRRPNSRANSPCTG